ncbi:MAG: winged helix-turn-helix domain-containing protein [Candidatus Levyibacteriota bacterium]
MLTDLITSKSRVKLLGVLLLNPSEMYHVRELVRRTGDEINAVRRELGFLESKGILVKEPRANRVYYSLSKSYPFYFDLIQFASKSIGLGADILKNRAKLGKIKFAMFSGKFARRIKKNAESVDLLIIGTVVLPELALLIKNEERRLGTEINYTAMTEEEFEFRKKRNDPFILSILSGSRIMLIGDEETMLS